MTAIEPNMAISIINKSQFSNSFRDCRATDAFVVPLLLLPRSYSLQSVSGSADVLPAMVSEYWVPRYLYLAGLEHQLTAGQVQAEQAAGRSEP